MNSALQHVRRSEIDILPLTITFKPRKICYGIACNGYFLLDRLGDYFMYGFTNNFIHGGLTLSIFGTDLKGQ